MRKGLIMLVLSLLFVVGLAAGCASGNNSNSSNDAADSSTGGGGAEVSATSGNAGPGATTGGTGETSEVTGGTTASSTISGTTSGTESASLEQISSGTMGPERRQILVASSADDLAAALGLRIPDSGEGAYVAVAWGEKPTGGYSVGFGSASVEGVRLEVDVDLQEPPQDAMVAQALTYPYSVAVLRGVDLGEKELVFVTQNGRELNWPVFNV